MEDFSYSKGLAFASYLSISLVYLCLLSRLNVHGFVKINMCFYEMSYFSYILPYLNKRDTEHTVLWIKECFRRCVLVFQCQISENKDSGSGISPEPLGGRRMSYT
jgi:hypothetical protein